MTPKANLLSALDRKVYAADTPIFREGDAGNAAYIVQKGQVQIWRNEGGRKQVLGTVGEGGIFGEMALVDRQPRMASATALEPTVCVVISDRVFAEKLKNADAFIVALLRIFCRNIRSMQEPDPPRA